MNIPSIGPINNQQFWQDYMTNRPIIGDNDGDWVTGNKAVTKANEFILEYILKSAALLNIDRDAKRSIGGYMAITLFLVTNEISKGKIAVHATKKSTKGVPLVYYPHVLNMAQGFAQFMEGRLVQLISTITVGDVSKYLIADMTKHKCGETMHETHLNYLWKLHNDFFSQDYILVPKTASKEERLKLIEV